MRKSANNFAEAMNGNSPRISPKNSARRKSNNAGLVNGTGGALDLSPDRSPNIGGDLRGIPLGYGGGTGHLPNISNNLKQPGSTNSLLIRANKTGNGTLSALANTNVLEDPNRNG